MAALFVPVNKQKYSMTIKFRLLLIYFVEQPINQNVLQLLYVIFG